ncbi:hypothetical protein Pint_20664 [Pistacia integerrima]|uniref:Uncharacterized protein n=1 Tax=Pistacia integerrima TaxID=434235 RepID=A0ACC0XB47_9ROSI|nr:hypothetical protein Pint_20664 [Pistacia integerrima]
MPVEGGRTLLEIYQSAKRALLRTRHGVEKLERLEGSTSDGDYDSTINQRRTNEARERAELLGRANGDSSHMLRIFGEEAQAMQSVQNSSRMLQESFVVTLLATVVEHLVTGETMQMTTSSDQRCRKLKNSSRMLQESFATGTAILAKNAE